MSRIATLATVLTMMVAPAAAFAGQDLRSPDATYPVTTTYPVQVAGQDLRSPDAREVFVAPSVEPQAAPSDDGGDVSPWAIAGLVAAALAACGSLTVMVRRHRQIGGTVGV
jgi:hypothetical protein